MTLTDRMHRPVEKSMPGPIRNGSCSRRSWWAAGAAARRWRSLRRGTTARHLRRNNDFPDAQGADAAGFRAAADARQLSGPSYRTEPPSSSRPGEPPGCLPGSTR